MSEHIQVEEREQILRVEFNRPAKRNAMTAGMYAALADALERAEQETTVRAIYFTGCDGCFTSGNDVGDFINPTDAIEHVLRVISGLATASKPLVAAVDGVAIGIGATMLLHCDLVYLSDQARLKFPFVDLGLVPEAGSSLLLPRLVGHQRASQLFMLGEGVEAGTAAQMGLANAVVPAGELEGYAWEKARALAGKPPAALRAIKRLMKRSMELPVADAIGAEGELFQERLASPELFEAVQAFMEKRAPDFSQFS